MKGFLSLLAVVLCVQGFAQGPPAKAAYLFNVSLGTWVADTTTTDAGAGDLPNAPPAAALYCLNTATNQWTPATTSGNCFGSGSGVSSVSGTANQIDVATGTTTPVISLDPAIIFPGTLKGVGATGGAPITGGINATQYLLNGNSTVPNQALETYNYCYGDSTMVGTSGVATQYMNGLCGRLTRDLPGPTYNYAGNGTFMYQIANAAVADTPLYNANLGIPFQVFLESMVNDANSFGAVTSSENNAQLALDAAVYFVELPTVDKVMASVATPTGTWAADTNDVPLNVSVVGTAMKSTTSASTLTFSITSATEIGLTWITNNANLGGTFTFKIDGVSQTSLCSGTTTFSNASCSATNFTGLARQEFAVTAGAHTCVVTVTSSTSASNPVAILDVDRTPSTSAGQNLFLLSGVIYQNANAAAAATAAYDAIASTVASTAVTDNLNVKFVSVRSGTPGVNFTTDMSPSLGIGGISPVHPNDDGYLHWAQTFENVATGLGVFFPGTGDNGNAGQFNFNYALSPVQQFQSNTGFGSSGGSGAVANTNYWWNTNINSLVPSASVTSPGIQFFGTQGISAVTFGYDNTHSQFVTALISKSPWGYEFMQCPSTLTVYSACTPMFYVDASGNGTLTGSFTFASSQTFTGVQGTAGTKLPAASGTFTNGNLRSTNSTGDEVDSGVVAAAVLAPVSNAISSATGGTGITSVTCATASCTNLRGTYTMTATTVSAGTILTLVWPTTTAAYACWTSQDGGATPFGISHSVATATGMTVSVAVSIATGSITFDYGCQP